MAPYPRRMNEYTVSIMGGGRHGIVAAVTGALLGAGGNVENCRAGILDRVASLALHVFPRRSRGRRG